MLNLHQALVYQGGNIRLQLLPLKAALPKPGYTPVGNDVTRFASVKDEASRVQPTLLTKTEMLRIAIFLY
jgi:hypothetical protein